MNTSADPERERRLRELIRRHLFGTIADDEARELEQSLAGSRELREEFRRACSVDAALRDMAAQLLSDDVETPASPSGQSSKSQSYQPQSDQPVSNARAAWTMAAVLAFFAVATVLWRVGLSPKPGDPTEAVVSAQPVEFDGVALLSQLDGVAWGADTTASEELRAEGNPLSPGLLQLEQGLLQIDFFNGASVVLEGPAQLELLVGGNAFLHYGKARVTVPPQAQGFRLEAASFQVVDLGTEFAMAVATDGIGEVHVIDGEVELHSGRGESNGPQLIRQGESMRVSETGQRAAASFAPESFDGAEVLHTRRAARIAAWKRQMAELAADPATLVLFDFDSENDSNRIRNLATSGPKHTDGVVVGCRRAKGRWSVNQGLEFASPSDRVRLNLPGTYRSLTLSAWVRIDALAGQELSLIDSEVGGAGYVFWKLRSKENKSGGLSPLLVTGSGEAAQGGKRQHYLSRVNLPPLKGFGNWRHFAVTVDLDADEVVHYINGQLLERMPMDDDKPLKIGIADVGNWPYREWAKGTPWARRHLIGCMDELLISQRAFAPAEIAALYRVGRP